MEDGQVRNIYVQAEASNRSTIKSGGFTTFRSNDGKLVPVSEFAEVSTLDVRRPGDQPLPTCYRTVLGGRDLEAIRQELRYGARVDSTVFRTRSTSTNIRLCLYGPGCSAAFGGFGPVCWLFWFSGSWWFYLVLSAQYESYVTPVIILMTCRWRFAWGAGLSGHALDRFNIYARLAWFTLIGLAAKERHPDCGGGEALSKPA